MSPEDSAEMKAKKLAGNHRGFSSFAWFDRPEDDDRWCIVYTHNRDSGILDESNAEAIAKVMDDPEYEKDVKDMHAGHWAHGWVDGYAIRVYDQDGKVTPAFLAYSELQDRIEEYQVLDEEDYSKREYEATLEAIRSEGNRFVKDDAPENWTAKVFGWLWEHDQEELENQDDQGAYPSKEAVKTALSELEYLTPEEVEE